MQKLQELITKHKEKLRDWYKETKLMKEYSWDDNNIIIQLQQPWLGGILYKSLSDLLFSTHFLSLLEWNDGLAKDVWIKQEMGTWKFIEWHSVYYTYHKINLALLKSDKERVEYINSFTL